MNISIQGLEIGAYYIIPKTVFNVVENILHRFNLRIPEMINKNGIIFTLSITKLLNSVIKLENNIGLVISTYIGQLSRNKRNYFTTLLFLLTLNKKYGKNIKTSYFKILYIICISKILYYWSFKKNYINKAFLGFLDKCCGLDKKFITGFRQEMKNNGWVSYNTSCPKGHFYDLVVKSFPKSLYNVSQILF